MKGLALCSSEKLLIKLAQDVRYYVYRRKCRREDAVSVLVKIGFTTYDAESYMWAKTKYQRDCIEDDYIKAMRRQYV